MTTRVFSYVPRNKSLQADVPVDHFAAGVAAAVGWQMVVEWRFRADPGDAWGAATIHRRTPPDLTSGYEPPGAGWVQVTAYAIQNGLTSRAVVREFAVDGAGEIVNPEPYVDDVDADYVDEDSNVYED